jgi:hypothetical protein
MTRSQRRRHLWWWSILGPSAIAFTILAMSVRRPLPLGEPPAGQYPDRHHEDTP